MISGMFGMDITGFPEKKCRKGKKWYVFTDEIGKSLTFCDIAGKTVLFALFSLIKYYNA